MGSAADRIETIRTDRIPDNPDLSTTDQDALLEFSDELYLRNAEYSDHRHEKLLRHCVLIAEGVGGLAQAREDRDTAEDLVRWINRTYDNEETNRDFRVALRVFGKHTTDGDDVPSSLDWISSTTSRSYKPQPDPANMLHWDDHIIPMIDACHNNRDAAIIAVAWDAGCRSGEFRNLTMGDVTDHKHGYQITVQGKQGQRSIVLVPSVPYLQRWLEAHPGGHRDDPLWCKLSQPESVSYQCLRDSLQTAGEKAGIEKPLTFTNLRKSSASHLARRMMNQAHLEDHHGWVRGSDVASRYISTFADDTNREVARLHGVSIDEEDEPEPTAPVECPRCHQTTPREKEKCIHCQQPLTKEAAMQHMKTCEYCGEPISSYPEHLPDCPNVDTGDQGVERGQADD
jgi:integrase